MVFHRFQGVWKRFKILLTCFSALSNAVDAILKVFFSVFERFFQIRRGPLQATS